MSEERPLSRANAAPLPVHELSDHEHVMLGLAHSLSGTALDMWARDMVVPDGTEMTRVRLEKWVNAFNSLPAEQRGKDRYDHSRPLTEHVDRHTIVSNPSNYDLIATVHRNGEVTFAISGGALSMEQDGAQAEAA
jgi:hypothetical protein